MENKDSVLEWFSDEIIQNYNQKAVSDQLFHDQKYFQPVRPPYMNFPDQLAAKEALRGAYMDNSFLLLYGYAGSGKTTICQQMAMKMPDNVFYFDQCSQSSPSALLGRVADKMGLSIKQRVSEIAPVVSALRLVSRKMLIFDDIVLDNDIATFQRIDMIKSLHEATNHPVVICGTNALYQRLYDDRWIDKYDHIRSRLITQEMKGMKAKDGYAYLQMMQEKENICFSINARQALVRVATNPKLAGIRKFTLIIGRITSTARADYYRSHGGSLPETAKCIEQIMAPGKTEPVPAFIYILPVTPEPLEIAEDIVLEEIEKCIGSVPKTNGRKKGKAKVEAEPASEEV